MSARYKQLGDLIRQMREERNLSREDLAKLMGYESHSSIYQIEIGRNSIPLKRIPDFAAAFQVDPNKFLDSCTNTFEPPPRLTGERTSPIPSDIGRQMASGELPPEFWNAVRGLLELYEQSGKKGRRRAPHGVGYGQAEEEDLPSTAERRAPYGKKKR